MISHDRARQIFDRADAVLGKSKAAYTRYHAHAVMFRALEIMNGHHHGLADSCRKKAESCQIAAQFCKTQRKLK